jgi:hypothetical protein
MATNRPTTATGEHVSKQNKNRNKLLKAREHSDRRVAERQEAARKELDRKNLILAQAATEAAK